jgi:hypothetical protein
MAQLTGLLSMAGTPFNAGASATGGMHLNLWRRLHLDCCVQHLNALNKPLQSKEQLEGRLMCMPFTQPRWQLLQRRSLPLLLAARAAPPPAAPPPQGFAAAAAAPVPGRSAAASNGPKAPPEPS